MKERPIIMTAESVRGILSGVKTQTRRVVKLRDPSQTYSDFGDGILDGTPHQDSNAEGWPCFANEAGQWRRDRCPFGAVGDRLWVREGYSNIACNKGFACVGYAADGTVWHLLAEEEGEGDIIGISEECECGQSFLYSYKSPLFMRRSRSRITLEIVSVAVQRLQEITEEDAKAEGVRGYEMRTSGGNYLLYGMTSSQPEHGRTAKVGYEIAWDEINGKKHPWESNPFVWCISFRRI